MANYSTPCPKVLNVSSLVDKLLQVNEIIPLNDDLFQELVDYYSLSSYQIKRATSFNQNSHLWHWKYLETRVTDILMLVLET